MGNLHEILPSGYDYYDSIDVMNSQRKIRMRLSTKSEVLKWLKNFEEKSFTTWRVARTFPKRSLYYIFKADYHCHHNMKVAGKKASKGTNCPAKIRVIVERYCEPVQCLWPMDPLIREWPCFIDFVKEHNHPLHSSSVLKYRDMSEETRQKLCDLYQRGYTPTSALLYLKTELFLEHPEDYFLYDGDGRYVPSLSKCAHLFNKEFKHKEATRSEKRMSNNVKQFLEEFSTATGGRAISGTTDDGHVYVCICTPLMERVHTMVKQSSEIVYVDAAGGMGRQRHRVYIITTSTPAGGLPLALIITDAEKETVFDHALKELIEHCLPEKSFFGQNYPTVIITDNDLMERKPLQAHFEGSMLLHCQLHVLKAVWAWLSMTEKHGIEKCDRQELFFLFKTVVYSRSEDELQMAFNSLTENEIAKEYPQYIEYVEKLWQEKEAWATCYRSELPIQGNNTTNYVEVAIHVLKDVILQRVMSFNMTRLVDFLLKSYESYVKKRLLSFANGHSQQSLLGKRIKSTIPLDEIREHETINDCFIVPSETKENVSYAVDINVCICECSHGNSGALCKHVSAVLKKLNVQSIYTSMTGESTVLSRKIMFQVATGKEPTDEWVLPFTSVPLQQGFLPHLQQIPEVEIIPSLWEPIICKVATGKEAYDEWMLPVTSEGLSEQDVPLLQQPEGPSERELPHLEQPEGPSEQDLPHLEQPEGPSEQELPHLQQPEVLSEQGLPHLKQPEVEITPSLWEPICQVVTEKEPNDGWLLLLPTSEVLSQQVLPRLKPRLEVKIAPSLAEIVCTSEPPQAQQQPEVELTPSQREPMLLDPKIKDEMQEKLKELYDRIIHFSETNPGVFVPAIRKMCQNAKSLTETELASALTTFGTYSEMQLLTKNCVAGVKRKGTPSTFSLQQSTEGNFH